MSARVEHAVQHAADALVAAVFFADRICHEHRTH